MCVSRRSWVFFQGVAVTYERGARRHFQARSIFHFLGEQEIWDPRDLCVKVHDCFACQKNSYAKCRSEPQARALARTKANTRANTRQRCQHCVRRTARAQGTRMNPGAYVFHVGRLRARPGSKWRGVIYGCSVKMKQTSTRPQKQ